MDKTFFRENKKNYNKMNRLHSGSLQLECKYTTNR